MALLHRKQPLAVGSPLPDLTLPDQNNTLHRLADYRGKQLILFFYPKDDTPGWTIEARGFRATMDQISAMGAMVFGVSVDSVKSHRAFAEKYKLNYPLLSDTKGELSAAMGVLRKLGPLKLSARVTFVIDTEGNISRVFDPVSPSGHAEEVIDALG